jgi:inosine-uridine nucleoside N-ribohydrolase
MTRESIFIDADNGLGSPSGDVDDGFAIAALIRAAVPVAAIAACEGNTREHFAFQNNVHLGRILGYDGPQLRANEAREFLRTFDGRIAALGPLTNVVDAKNAAEVVIVGGTLNSPGRWPPIFPFEFNLTFDRPAALTVFNSDVPLTIFPIDVSRRLYALADDLSRIGGEFGDFARRESKRWFRHLFWLRQTRRFPIYDLAAAFYLIGGEGLTMEDTVAEMRPNTWIRFGRGNRKVKVCTALRRELLWERFVRLVE